ncbi:hypothetical protein L1987_28590 [Smallanthus sonchifolius]|uniref:Uncharacterized protein n=1 Tax=Smallanthus sonchifolius TaxID=185202 RepID=A0ACB9HX53_9ASTR|nr:hypothetical protein L1987_28590 [Smallanthus sonchifolius]
MYGTSAFIVINIMCTSHLCLFLPAFDYGLVWVCIQEPVVGHKKHTENMYLKQITSEISCSRTRLLLKTLIVKTRVSYNVYNTK